MLKKMKNSTFLSYVALTFLILGFVIDRQGLFLSALISICASMIIREIEEGREVSQGKPEIPRTKNHE